MLPPRLGGVEAAARWLITCPVPRRICARGPASSAGNASVSIPAAPSGAAGRCGARDSVGGGIEAQAASSAARKAAIA
ncbi:hypothetical protein L599_004300000150 [Luteimonas sp. J16]|nr:hypothetical protein L599_004300000150 [Luteimonas sp. J16]